MKNPIVFILLLTLFAACKKKDKTCKQDTAGISGSHRVTTVTYKASASSAEQDFYNQLYPDPCDRDDLVILKTDGTYTFTDAGVQCVPTSDDTGTWSVSGSTVSIDGDPYIIESFNCSNLVILATDFNVPGDQIKYTFTRQ